MSILLISLVSSPALYASQLPMKNYLNDAAYPDTFWQTSSPEKEAMDKGLLERALTHIQKNKLEIHSFLIIKNGKLVFEYYGQEKKELGKEVSFVQRTPADAHELHSVTKTFTAALLSIAIERKLISGVDAKVIDFFNVQEIKNIDEKKLSMTLENLLTMQSGLEYAEGNDDPLFFDEKQPVSALSLMSRPMASAPGTIWNYSSGNSQILAEILRKVTKKTPLEFSKDEIFTPLGIKNVMWNKDPSGTEFGGWGLFLTPRDLARFGYLYLQKGRWESKQIISEEWIAESSKAHAQTPWYGDKYGYHMWVPRVGGYAAFGYMGQDMFILPEQNMVVVFTSALPAQFADKLLIGIVREFVLKSIKAKKTIS
jgi:CubicO group peptidase (beta-lactamase class C family)